MRYCGAAPGGGCCCCGCCSCCRERAGAAVAAAAAAAGVPGRAEARSRAAAHRSPRGRPCTAAGRPPAGLPSPLCIACGHGGAARDRDRRGGHQAPRRRRGRGPGGPHPGPPALGPGRPRRRFSRRWSRRSRRPARWLPTSRRSASGFPALVDRDRAVSQWSDHLPLDDVPFRDLMSERLGLPVCVDNDANLALLAEHAGRGGARRVDALMLTLGTASAGRPPRRAALPRGDRVGRRARPHRRRHRRAAMPGQLPEPRLPGGDGVGHGDRPRGRGAAAQRDPESALGRVRGAGAPVTGALVTELAHDGDPVARRCSSWSAGGSGWGSRRSATPSTPR